MTNLTIVMIFYLVKNFSVFILSKKMKPSSDFQDFPGPASEFQDFPGLENDFLKFQDFPGFQGPVRTLS